MSGPADATIAIPRIVVVGSINLDITARVHRLPQPGETIASTSLTRLAGGKGANQAAAVARLLGRSELVGSVGDDSTGAELRHDLNDAGVDTRHVRTVRNMPSGVALIAVDESGENQIIVHPGANLHVQIPPSALRGAAAVLTQLEIGLDTVHEAARHTSGYFAVNASPPQPLPESLINRADLIVVNHLEYDQIPTLHQATNVVVTYGAGGSTLFERGTKRAHIPAIAAPVSNTVGAGDVYFAALTCTVISGHDLTTAMVAATRAAAFAIADPASQPALHPLQHYLPDPHRAANQYVANDRAGEARPTKGDFHVD